VASRSGRGSRVGTSPGVQPRPAAPARLQPRIRAQVTVPRPLWRRQHTGSTQESDCGIGGDRRAYGPAPAFRDPVAPEIPLSLPAPGAPSQRPHSCSPGPGAACRVTVASSALRWLSFFKFYFVVLGFFLRAFTLTHSSSPFFVKGFSR
jgi:hypothetical protein